MTKRLTWIFFYSWFSEWGSGLMRPSADSKSPPPPCPGPIRQWGCKRTYKLCTPVFLRDYTHPAHTCIHMHTHVPHLSLSSTLAQDRWATSSRDLWTVPQEIHTWTIHTWPLLNRRIHPAVQMEGHDWCSMRPVTVNPSTICDRYTHV